MSVVLNQKCVDRAEAAAGYIKRELVGVIKSPEIAILFTSGLDETMGWHLERRMMPLRKIPGFEFLDELGTVKGHSRKIFTANIAGVPIFGLSGRIHLNEGQLEDPVAVRRMVRLQYDMLLELGVRIFIITSAVGTCSSPFQVGQIGVAENFIGGDGSMTGCEGEFPMTVKALDPELVTLALQMSMDGFQAAPVTHYYWKGPEIESPAQKRIAQQEGGHAIGMSARDGAEAVARYGRKGLVLLYAVNGSEHDDSSVEEAVEIYGKSWADHLVKIMRQLRNRGY